MSTDAYSFDDTQSPVASLLANKIIIGHALWNDLSGASLPPLLYLPLIPYLAPSSFFFPSPHANPRLVLGLPYPAVLLYRPFRNALRSNDRLIGLQTLMWHLVNLRVQNGRIVPVRCIRPFFAGIWVGLILSRLLYPVAG